MMDYSILESDFDCACGDVITNLTAQYKLNYQSGGPGKLEAFLDLIKTEFEKAETTFISKHKLDTDPKATRLIRFIARKHAKKCLENYGKII